MRTYEEIQQAVIKKGYKFFTAEKDVNLIFERTSDEFTNLFTDWFYLLWVENGQKKILSFPCTTKSGLYGTGTATQPIKGGVAVVVPNQYRGVYKWIDTGKGWNKYPFDGEFFALQGNIKIWRDNDKDKFIDKGTPILATFMSGINIHKMSQPNQNTPNVNNWSNGCLGMTEPHFKSIIPIIKASIPLHGDMFSLTLLETKDF